STALDGIGRRLLRQRDVRELFRHARVRVARSGSSSRSSGGRTGRVRLHRGLLQHASAAFRPRLSLADGVREEHRGGGMTPRVASAPADVKLRCAQLLRFASALRVTSSSAAALCAYAESRAFGIGDTAGMIKTAPAACPVVAQLLTRPRNRGRLMPPDFRLRHCGGEQSSCRDSFGHLRGSRVVNTSLEGMNVEVWEELSYRIFSNLLSRRTA